MQKQTMFASLSVSWLGTAATFITSHINFCLSLLCGLASLIASWYAIKVSRATLRLREKQLKEAGNRVKTSALVLATLMLLLLSSGCVSTAPNALDRSLYTLATNYTPHVIVQTNTVIVTNTVPVVVEHTNTVVLTNAAGIVTLQTNVFNVTNFSTVLTFETNILTSTNLVPHLKLQAKPDVEQTLRATGGAVGSIWGMGGIFAAVVGGLYHGYMQFRNRRVTGALVQSVETAREILKTTPQGQQLDQKYLNWLVSHQKEAEVIGAVSKLVDSFVDNEAAREAAKLIAQPTN